MTEGVSILPILPQPRKLELSDEYFDLGMPFRIIGSRETQKAEAIIRELFNDGLDSATGKGTGTESDNILQLKPSNEHPLEGYTLSIESGHIQLVGDTEGLCHAASTLRLLVLHALKTRPEDPRLPGLLVRDEPAFRWRGFQLDCSRHFIQKATILRYLDYLSLFKLNRFHWHLTDDQGWRIESRKYPRLTEIGAWRGRPNERYGGYYTQDDIREVVRFAADRGIVVVPEIDVPGHATAILAAYPEFGCGNNQNLEVEINWGIFHNNLNAGDEGVYEFMENLLDEVIELFPSPWIHVGADECQKEPWMQCPDCQRKIREAGLADELELQSYFITRILKHLEKRGRMGIGWDEVLEGGCPENIIVQAWQDHSAAIESSKLGRYSISSPRDHCYLNYAVNTIDMGKVHAFNPIPRGLQPKLHDRILGGECLIWTEYINEQNLDYMVFPRLIAFAESVWCSPEDKPDYADFEARLRAVYPILNGLGIQPGPASAPQGIHDGIMGRMDA